MKTEIRRATRPSNNPCGFRIKASRFPLRCFEKRNVAPFWKKFDSFKMYAGRAQRRFSIASLFQKDAVFDELESARRRTIRTCAPLRFKLKDFFRPSAKEKRFFPFAQRKAYFRFVWVFHPLADKKHLVPFHCQGSRLTQDDEKRGGEHFSAAFYLWLVF